MKFCRKQNVAKYKVNKRKLTNPYIKMNPSRFKQFQFYLQVGKYMISITDTNKYFKGKL